MRERMSKWARGRIVVGYTNPIAKETRVLLQRSNVITYTAADTMARIVGGQADYVPRYMGFIYGTDANPGLSDPDTLPAATRRIHPWSQIASDLAGVAAGKANVVICPLVTTPAVALDGDASHYVNNAVTITANTGSRLEYGFALGGTYAPALQDDGSDYMFQALLLSRTVTGTTINYFPFARVSLADSGVYSQKPVNWELSVTWTIVFE